MDYLKTLLIANRGEIAVRICKTAKKLNIKTIAIFSEADAASQHVRDADEAIQLPGKNATAYTDEEAILRIAKENAVDAIIPGYGFLSENADFARSVKDAGIAWVGPSPESIEAFGIKHTARELAEKAQVPIVPGTKGLVENEGTAIEDAQRIGYPVMLKATAGGGGMGLVTCNKPEELREGFNMVQSRGKALFKNSGVFIEAFYRDSHHIEVQVFGNGRGQAIHFGERECSIQRRHQKVIEECPSPFVEQHKDLRKKLGDASVRLAESIHYGSAGTIEYLVDDKSGDFFFLEMNTRLQVEHGITELCYNVDLVELMLRQADAELSGKGGLDAQDIKQMQPVAPSGSAMEARVYAENPLKDYAPSPGLLQKVEWHDVPGSRVDTWVFTGSRITPNYDPLIAKVMVHSGSRQDTIKQLSQLLNESLICGPPTNLQFLAKILEDTRLRDGKTMTNFLSDFAYYPAAIDVISAGAYTLIQDLPGRPTIGKGIPHSGAMDPMAFQIANILVGNPRGMEGLEITLSGPDLRFVSPAIVALCGAPMEATLDGEEFPMWASVKIEAGQRLRIGKTIGGGCRAYLAVHGGFPSVADYFGSKSTSPLVSIGGYQGRALAPGDLLEICRTLPENFTPVALPKQSQITYRSDWEIAAMVGPHDEGYFDPDFIQTIYDTKWKVSHNASRSGIRLVGPVPKWARKDGGEGGAHPSNLIEYGYPLGTLNWTGDDPCIFPVDCPNFGGFTSSTTVIKADWWKLGQLKAGNTLKYIRVGLQDALKKRERNEAFLRSIEQAVRSKVGIEKIEPLNRVNFHECEVGKAVIWEKQGDGTTPRVRYRQGGDNHLLVEYGEESFDLNHRCRVTALENALRSNKTPESIKKSLYNTVGCCTTLLIYYNGAQLPRSQLMHYLQEVEAQLGNLSTKKVPTRIFKLPISFESKLQDEATQRYMTNQRPHAPYLPDNLAFVAKNNAFTPQQLKDIYLSGQFMAVVVGFFCGNTVSLPVDPRQRISAPKMNPSRVFTPEGTVGWAGSCMSIYPVDSPGGYQMTGRTVPCWDYYSHKPGFVQDARPWIFRDFDILTFYQVSEQELDDLLSRFRAGKYQWDYEEFEFDMAEHNRLITSTREEVAEIRKKQAVAQDEMTRAENESLERWRKEKAESQVDESTVEKLLDDPKIVGVEAPVDANVWKVEVAEGTEVDSNTVIIILEAMKLEIAVKKPETAANAVSKVEKILVKSGDTVTAGTRLALVKEQ